jgi:hypothetical protein
VTYSEESAALRLFHYNWIVIAGLAVALVFTMVIAGFSIVPMSALMAGATAAVYLAAAFYNSRRGTKRDPLVIFALGSTGQVLVIAMLIGPMTYVAASADFPLQDANLAAIDRALGLNWPAYFKFMTANDTTISAAVFAYSMIRWPIFAIPVVLAFGCKYRHLQKFTLALAISLICTTAISAVVPAVGIYDAKAVTGDDAMFQSPAYLVHLHDFPAVRDGTLRQLDLMKLAGIVTFPSFHATSAVLFLWAMWAVWWMRPVALLSMGAMLFATPMVGGHYFIDVIAGIALAVAAIAAAKWIGNWLPANAGDAVADVDPVAVSPSSPAA